MSGAPRNSRRAPPAERAPKKRAPRADPLADDESPIPAPTSTSVRPPPGPAAPRRRLVDSRAFKALQLVAGVMVVLAASISVAYGARRYVLTSPRFAVKTVAVDGVRRRTALEVAREGGLEIGKNVFSIDLARAGAMITQDPWIERATVTRTLPGTLRVTVVEREAAAAVSIGSDLYLATRDGDLFKRVATDDPSDLPVVTGIPAADIAADRAGVVLAVKRVLDVAEEIERTGLGRRYPVQELHLEKDGALVAFVGREAIALHLGHAPFRDKIEQASRVLNEVARRKANASVVFLDNDAHPERVVVRMR
ncbi:MAG TPA: FtsQ-type POTRA domain-containing protein [Minicystis sp.]|nr:FtsQ-type POTRA domain-containing protein [Minicystis sp.]